MKIRSGYSFKTAFGHLPDVASRLQEIDQSFAPLTDRISTYGFARWTRLCEKSGLKPIYGVEIGVVKALGEKKPSPDFWTFIARDSLRPLHDLINLATSNPGREPSLLYKQALFSPSLFKIAGERLQIEALPDDLPPNFFVALMPSTPKGLIRRCNERGLKFVASSDNYFPRAKDEELYRVALGRRSGTQTYPRWILSDDEWRSATAWLVDSDAQDAALAARNSIAERCNATMKKGALLRFPATMTLRELCLLGADKKGVDLSNEVYSERFERELKLIAEKDFEDYFFILADLVGWAKQRMIVGPARGSSCGSLVCYLLDITAVDPLPYGLLFERFIDTNRLDLPDIDVDFDDKKRHLVFEYAEEKYGKDHVARLGTVGMFQSRSAINQASSALRVPKWKTEKVTDRLIEYADGDERSAFQLEDTLKGTDAGRALVREFPEIAIAAKMEDHPNNPSQHAAGIIITERPVAEYVAVDGRTQSTMCDKKDSEALNLLKIDALGLTQLSIFGRTLELIGEAPRSSFFDKIPLNDPAAFDVLNSGRFSGIFQLAGNALRSLTRQTRIEKLEDIVAITALARPGPLSSGGAASWVRRKNGQERILDLHPRLTALTAETHGVIVYQETIMQVVREIGGLSWEDTSAIRKAMSKSLGNEVFAQYRAKFLKGATASGIDVETTDNIWFQIQTMGQYSFNKSHAVAYGIVSYWSCWLKAHHPIAFAAATLDAEKEPGKQIALLKELRAEGIDYVPFDAELSTDRWVQGSNKDGTSILIGPLTTIKGIGPAVMREVIDARKSGKPLRAAIRKRLEKASTEIDSLDPIRDRIRAIHPDLTAIGIVTTPTPVIRVQPGVQGDVLILAVLRKLSPKDENEPVNVQKRGYRVNGPDQAINMFFADDTDEIFCKIGRFDYARLASKVLDKAKTGKSIFAIKGTVPKDFRMISVKQIKLIGEM